MVFHGQLRKDHPSGRILYKALRLTNLIFLSVLDFQGLIAVIHSRRRAEDHRRAILFRYFKSLLDHLICIAHAARIEHGNLREHAKGPGILLRLRRNGAGIIRHEHHHAALDANVFKAHQRVGRHVQSHLLHGHHRTRPRIGRARRHFHGRLLVDGPFHVRPSAAALCDRLKHLRGRRSRISRH